MTSGKSPVGITSQFALAEFEAGQEPGVWAKSVNEVFGLITDDLQRLAGRQMPTLPVVSGTYRAVMPASGRAQVYAISDTATSASSGGNYLSLSATRNGTTPLQLTYDTRRTEVVAYQGGMYLGELTVSAGDVIAVAIAVTGAPTPVLTTANFALQILLKET